MLVPPRKLVELPKGVSGVFLTPDVWLQIRNCLLRLSRDACSHAFEVFLGLFGLNVLDRKGGIIFDFLRQRPLCVRQRQFEGEIVKGGTKVVQAVPDNEAQRGRWFAEHFTVKDLLLTIIGLGHSPSSVRFFV